MTSTFNLSTSASVRMALVSVLLDTVVVAEAVVNDCTVADVDTSMCTGSVTAVTTC